MRDPKRLGLAVIAFGASAFVGLFTIAVIAGNEASCGTFVLAGLMAALTWWLFKKGRFQLRESRRYYDKKNDLWIDNRNATEAPPMPKFGANLPQREEIEPTPQATRAPKATTDDEIFEDIVKRLNK